jgi:hypothetical protein
MFDNLSLGRCLKVATGVWAVNLVIRWIIGVFKD